MLLTSPLTAGGVGFLSWYAFQAFRNAVRPRGLHADGAPNQALFVKTSLHSKIVGDRRLYRWKVARSIGLSTLVHDSLTALPAGLSYFPETLGLVPRQMPDSGVIVRSIPPELKDDRLLVAPLFSLMGGGAAALFVTMVEQGRVQPLEFLEDVLCDRFARLRRRCRT